MHSVHFCEAVGKGVRDSPSKYRPYNMESIPPNHFKRAPAKTQLVEKSEWDFTSSSDQLTVATVFALKHKHDLKLLCDSGPQAMQNAVIKEGKPDIKVWWAEVPRFLLRMGHVKLAISVTESGWIRDSHKDAVGDKEIPDTHRYGYLFNFSPSFGSGEVKSDVKSPSSQFLYLVEHFLRMQNYQSIIPQLVLQYTTCESQFPVEKRVVYECIERVFRRHEDRLCVGFAGCIFAVLGSLQFTKTSQDLRCAEALLLYVNEAFIHQLTLCRSPEFVSAVAKGVAHCLFPGVRVPEEVKQTAISHLVKCERVATDFLDKALQTVEKVERSQLNLWIEVIKKQADAHLLVKKLLMKIEGYSPVFRVLQYFDFFSLEDPDDLKFLKQVLDKAKSHSYYYDYQVSPDEIEEVLDVLSTGSESLKELFQQSPLPGIIKRKLDNPSKSCLSLYKRLFVTQYDYKLVGKVKKADFLRALCRVQEVSFAYVANELEPDEEDVDTLFQRWMEGNCTGASYNWKSSYSDHDGHFERSESYRLISKIDNELEQLVNTSYLPVLSRKAIEFFSKKFPLSSRNLPSVAKSIDAVKTEALKLAYTTHESVLTRLITDRPDVTVHDLLRVKEDGVESWTIDRLLEHSLGAIQALTYEEAEAKLIEQREVEGSWTLLMKEFRSYKDFRLAANLKELIQVFTANVQTRHLSISKFLKLSTKAPEELLAVCRLLAYAGEAEDHVNEILQNLKESFDASVAIGANIALLTQFSTEVITDPADRAAVLEELHRLQETYQEDLLDAFQLTPTLQALLTTAVAVQQFVDSGLFRAEIAQAQRVKAVTVADCQATCYQAIETVMTNVYKVLDSVDGKKVAEVLKVFAQVEDWQKEIDLLMAARPDWQAHFLYLSEGLRYYHSREALQKNCTHLLSLQRTIRLEDTAATAAAERYVQACARAEEMLFGELVLMHREIASTLYPDGDSAMSEAAFQVLAELQDASELTRFLQELSEERLKHLLECVNDYDESTVTAQLIFQLETAWHFFSEVRSGLTCSQLVAMVTEKLQTPEFAAIKEDIHVCSLNVRAVMELSVELEKKEEAKRKQIDAFFKSSELSFIKKDDSYAVSARYSERQKVPLNLYYLQELKDRASLSLHATNSKEDDSSLQTLHVFVDFVSETQRTIDTLTSLYDYGYPEDIADGRLFYCTDGNFQELREFQVRATALLQEWKNCIEDAYLRSYPLTFLFGTQFWTLEDHLYGLHHNEAVSLLAYMHRTTDEMQLREVVPQPAERLHCLGQLLDRLPTSETAPLQIQYEAPVKAKIKSPAGCVLYISVPADRVLHALVSAYLNSGRPFPQAHQVLHCARKTQWAELQAFLYRCFASPLGEMFALIGSEKLPLELQTAMRTLFAKLVASGIGKGHFSLAVITGEDNSLLAEYFQLLEDPKCVRVRSEQVLSDENVLGQLIRQVNTSVCGSPTVVVRSETAGQGKTLWVQAQAEALGSPLRKFPIAGDLDLEVVCRQLLEAVRPGRVLLLILSHVDSAEVLNDLLTCVCLLRTVRAGSLVVNFPLSCRVFVEVQNLQPPLPLPFLGHLTQEVIRFDINRIKLTEESKMVVAYLHLYETNALARGNVSEVQVTTEMAVSLLTKHFLDPQVKRGQPLSFLAVRSFISVVAALLAGMEQSPFNSAMIEFMISDAAAAGVPQLKQEYENLRAHIVNSFLQTCEEVTTRCVAQVRSAQGKALENVAEAPALQCTLTWDQSNHFSMIFLSDGSHVAIYRKQEHVPASLKKLIYLQSNCHRLDGPTLMQHIASNQFQITDYANLTHLQALAYLQTYAKMGLDLVERYCDSSYVMTQDNFLKMNLIYLRAIAKLPIVIMGETGCGKTSLIRFFVQDVLCERLEVVNIHAGVSSTLLAARINEISQLAIENFETRLWVFFDEFNTSDCVGQICEMLCERTFRGEELPPNVVLLAACNPYRLRPAQLAEDNVGIKKSVRYRARSQQNLMHVVKPLPEAVIEYIWDFGALTDNDSRKYIETMLKQMKSEKYGKLFSGLVCESQKYFHRLEDVSSVSLRDVARFVILYQWFEASLKARESMRNNDRFQQNCRKYQLHSDWSVLEDEEFCAGVLALCNCYYYRLSKQDQRQDYLETVCRQANGQLSVERIEEVLRCNEDDFIARMELPDATALNQAFRENLSCLLHCIFCKIALFICGKPGCSKSLAVQLVFSNLRGGKSVDPYFRTLPELVMVPFQGSESCTSEGIQKVFDRAKRFLSSGSLNLLPVVVFDEIGLAEISKHNPLKVLHSLLELENRSVGFVGVSNWRLDASKMNRAMYLARPDPDCEQLKFTARSIFLACKQQTFLRVQIELVEVLAVAYFEYKEELRGTRDADFFGLRDFYSMIKQTSYLLISDNLTDPEATFRIVKYSVERNFGGKAEAAARMLQLVMKHRPEFQQFGHWPPTPTIELINGNLKDTRARFLMLICKGDVATYAIDRYIELPQMERRTLVGSHMREDEGGEEYAFRSLSDMILYMEKGISVILKDMDHVYTSLYDLFNQNFAVSGDRRYCRVALGAQFNPRCFVHSDFHVIVFMSDDDDVLEQTDAPFLNRFEKHRFDIDQAFKQQHLQSFELLRGWTESLATLANGEAPLVSLNHSFPLYSPEYLKLLVLFHDSEGSIVDSCKEELMQMASQEVVLLAHAGVMEPEEKAYIQEAWKRYHKEPFLSHLSAFCLNQAPEGKSKSLVFLYNTDILQHELLSQLPVATYYQHFSSFRRELDVVEDLVKFYRGPNQLYILDFNLSKDGAHLVMVKFIVEKISKELRDLHKKVCLLVRLMRNVPIDIEVCWFDQWDIRTFTSSREQDLVFSEELVRQSLRDIVLQHSFYDFEAGLGKLTLEAYQTIAFKTGDVERSGEEVNEYIFSISEQVTTSPRLVEALRDKLLSLLPKKRWLDEVLCRPECVAKAPNIPTAIRCTVELELAAVYPRVLYAVDKFSAFSSFFAHTPENEFLQQVWLGMFDTLRCDVRLQQLKQSNRLDFSLQLDFPFVRKDYDMLGDVFSESRELPADQSESHFYKKYSERSVLRNYFDEVSRSQPLQDIYFRDLIRIDLQQSQLARSEPLLTLLHRCFSCDCPSIEGKVWSYVQNRDFSLALCGVVTALQDLKLEGVSAIYTRLTEFLQQYQRIEEDEGERESAASAARSVLNAEIKAVVSKVTTSSDWLRNAGSARETALLLNRLFNWINCLNSMHGFLLENFDEIDILALCFQVLSPSPQASNSLQQLQKSAASVTEGQFLYNDAFSQELFTIIQSNCSADDTKRVLSVYLYKLLIWNEVFYLPMVAAQIDDDEWKLWKHSSMLVSEVVRTAGLNPDKWTLVTQVEQSPFTDELERILAEGAIYTRFSVLLCDADYWYMKRMMRFDSAESAAVVASEYFEAFQQFSRLVADPHIAYACIMKVHSSAFMRCYLEAYCKVVHEELSLPPNSAIRRVSHELDSDWFPTARAYVLKYWKRREKLSVPRLQQALRQRSQLPWTRHFTFPEHHNEAVPCAQLPYYQRVSQWTAAVLGGEEVEPLTDLVNAADSTEDAVSFATAMMMNAYLPLAKGQANEALAYALQTATGLIQRKFGSAMSRLVGCFVSNFPQGSCMRLSAQTSEEDKYRALPMCYALITLFANANVASPLTSLFLDQDGNVRPDLVTAVNRGYVCGVGCNPLYSWLQHLRDNFDTLKSTTVNRQNFRGSANKCSCGYVYIINNCGGPMEVQPCPFCKQPIGGNNHLWVQRDGHVNMTDQEAITFMEQGIALYKTAPEAGYCAFDGVDTASQPLRGMAPLAHCTLHLVTVLIMRFLNLCNLLPDTDLQAIVRCTQQLPSLSGHLEEQICKDFASVKRTLNTEDSHLWWYSVLKQLPEFMRMHAGLPIDLPTRTRLEAQFDAFLQPFCQSPVTVVRLQKENSANSGANALSLLNETDLQGLLPAFPLLHLFRLTQDPDVLSLSTVLELQQLGEQYPLLSLYLQLREDVAKLSLLSPLIEFTNHMRNCFDHRIKREEARARRLVDVFRDDPKAKELFARCAGVWTWLETSSVSYECHQLPPKKFTSSDELIFFLADKQENGGGMYMTAALLKLADIQNTVMNGFLTAMERKLKLSRNQIIDVRKIPIQELKAENVVQYSLETLDDFEGSFLNNPAYGEGGEVVYNFPRIEEQIQSNFEKGRLLTGDKLDFICYQFEMLSTSSQHSDLITSIRACIAQRAFDSVQVATIERFLSKQEDDTAEIHQQELTAYYESLNSMLCFLRNAPVKPEMTLLEFAQKVNKFSVCEAFTRQTPLALVRMEQIVALYELLECWLFPYSKPFVKSDFKQYSEEVTKFLSSLDLSGTRPLGELQLVVTRLILRLLIADIDPSQQLAQYVARPDLWAENCKEDEIEWFTARLEKLPLSHAIQVYDFFDKRVKDSHVVSANLQLPRAAPVQRSARGRGR